MDIAALGTGDLVDTSHNGYCRGNDVVLLGQVFDL